MQFIGYALAHNSQVTLSGNSLQQFSVSSSGSSSENSSENTLAAF